MAIRIIRAQGPRIAEDDYGDYLIHVSPQYSVETDGCPFLVFIGRRGEKMLKVGDKREAYSEEEAYDHGFAIGRAAIDDLLPSP